MLTECPGYTKRWFRVFGLAKPWMFVVSVLFGELNRRGSRFVGGVVVYQAARGFGNRVSWAKLIRLGQEGR